MYQTIEQPKFLSWLDTFTDSKGNPVPSSHYRMPGENPYDDSILESMTKGWNGMFDKLEVLLKNQ